MKETRRAGGLIQSAVAAGPQLIAAVLASLALACDQTEPPTSPAHVESAGLHARMEGVLSARAAEANPTFTTIDGPGAVFTEGNDVGPTGDIVGRYAHSDGKSLGYVLRGGIFSTIDLSPTFTGAIGINARGEIVGRFQTADGKFHGFVVSGSAFRSIDVPGAAATNALGINSEGDIVGGYCDPAPCPSRAYRADLGNHGFVLHEGTFTSIDVPGAVLTQAWKINSRGQVAGRYEGVDGKWHAFLMSNGAFRSIDGPVALQTAAFPPQVGLNDHGDIVSSYCSAEPCAVRITDNVTTEHGFLLRHEERDEAGPATTIDFPGARITGAFGINARGDIVGAYLDANHKVHAYLRPAENTPVPVTGTFKLTFEPVTTRQVDGSTIIDFTFREQVSGSVAGVRVGTGTLVVHPDGTLDARDSGVFTGAVAGVSGSVVVPVRAAGTFASFTATARFDGNSGTDGLKGLRGTIAVKGAATGPTTLEGSYEGQVQFKASAADD